MASLSKIGAGTTIRGNIRGAGDLDIEGRIEGSVEIKGEILLAESSRLRSGISASRVLVRGAIAGDIQATEAIVLEEGARVVGDLSAPSIGIRSGGLLRGHVSSGNLSAEASPARAKAAAPVAQTARAQSPAAIRQPQARSAPAVTARQASSGASTQASVTVRQAPPAPPSAPATPVVQEVAAPPPGPPAPVMPTLQRGARATMKKKSAR